jgi:hypothetical protein
MENNLEQSDALSLHFNLKGPFRSLGVFEFSSGLGSIFSLPQQLIFLHILFQLVSSKS